MSLLVGFLVSNFSPPIDSTRGRPQPPGRPWPSRARAAVSEAFPPQAGAPAVVLEPHRACPIRPQVLRRGKGSYRVLRFVT